ncbi:MAG: tripartite tricarboxylate transporter substrate binding protein [Burkholderiales bacterium]|nr:tripartite tricarboxylate transporter substrate binding protein [Burkholderiales bacterium]
MIMQAASKTATFALVGAASLLPCVPHAQSYPAKPIRVIVPFAPGGVADVVTRTVTPRLAEALRQQVLIDNRGGAGGTIGTEIGAKAPPDGYTLTIPAASHTTTPGLYRKLPFDPVKDFSGITQLVTVPYLLVVHPSLPVRNVREFIVLAKSKSNELAYGSAGNGSSNHLAGELFKIMSGAPVTHVAYKGSAPAMTDLLGGHIGFMFDAINTSLPHMKTGRIRALGIGTLKASRVAPEVPTIASQGLPGYEANTWIGVLAPAATPREIVHRLNAELVKVLKAPDIQERMSSQGAEPVGSSPEQFDAFVRSEVTKWAKVIRDAKVPFAD